MQSTTPYSRGDVVLVPYAFTDRNVAIHRPALVLSADQYHEGRQEVIVAAITSRIRNPLLTGDHFVDRWSDSGLIRPSVVTGILRTVKNYLIVRKMGTMPLADFTAVENALRIALDL